VTNARPTVARDDHWLRGRTRFENGAITLDRATAQEYSPLADGAPLLWDFAAIRRPQDAIEFGRRFGLLHHGPGADSYSEPWAEWESTALHVHSLLVTVMNVRASRRGDGEATAYLRQLTSTDTWRALWQSPRPTTDGERRTEAATWVAAAVSEGLARVAFGVQSQAAYLLDRGKPGPPDHFMYAPTPTDLLGWIYYNLAQTLIASRPTRSCARCGVIFLVTDDRQRFHDKRCAQRARYHRSAEKRRNVE